jgi:hypothetical protein
MTELLKCLFAAGGLLVSCAILVADYYTVVREVSCEIIIATVSSTVVTALSIAVLATNICAFVTAVSCTVATALSFAILATNICTFATAVSFAFCVVTVAVG